MVQLQAINYILKTGDSAFFVLNNLTEDYFSDYKDEFNYIKSHYTRYGNVPDYETFLSIFDKFNVIEVNESPKYLLDELFKDKQTRHIAECVNKMREPLMRGDVNLATKIYLDGVQELTQSINLESTDIFKDAETRYEAYEEKVRDFSKFYVTTGFPELDEVIGGWDRKEELATIMARPGAGKCFCAGTSIRMADGTTKNVEDIVVGDTVMSEEGLNTVTELHHGFSDGYRIIPRDKSQAFTVTSGHILTVYKANEIWDSSKRMYSTDGTGTLVDMTVEEYLEKSNHYKYRARLYQPAINYNEKALNIPPYILGLWLGDGTGRELTLTTVDSEILTEWNNYATANDCLVSKRKDEISYSIIDSEDKRKNSSTFSTANFWSIGFLIV